MSDDLVRRLRDQQTKWMTPLLAKAADRIETLEAENKRLRETLHSVAYWSRVEGNLPWCRDIIRATLDKTSTPPRDERNQDG